MRRILFARRAQKFCTSSATARRWRRCWSCRSSSCSSCRTRRRSRSGTRRPTSSTSIGPATSRGLVGPVRARRGHFRIVGSRRRSTWRTRRCCDGRVTMVLTIPDDFERVARPDRRGAGAARRQRRERVGRGHRPVVRGADSRRLRQRAGAELPADSGRRMDAPAADARVPRIDVRVRSWYNPTLNYQHYMVPGILVALVTMIGTLLTAQNIAREKELGTLEQLNVTPITRGQFIAAKLLPFWVLALIELSLGLIVGGSSSTCRCAAASRAALRVAGDLPGRRARHRALDLDARRDAAAGDVRHLLHHHDLPADERTVHADRQHAALGADPVASSTRCGTSSRSRARS